MKLIVISLGLFLLSQSVHAESRQIKQSYSGGSASAAMIEIKKDEAISNTETERASLGQTANTASKHTIQKQADQRSNSSVRRSFSGGSGLADQIKLDK